MATREEVDQAILDAMQRLATAIGPASSSETRESDSAQLLQCAQAYEIVRVRPDRRPSRGRGF